MSTDKDGQAMQSPRWEKKWEWSPNTIAIMLGFVGMIAAWGYGLATFANRAENAEISIAAIRTEIRRIEEADRILDSHEIRLTAVERRQGEASADMRDIEAAINGLSSDVRLTREILERLEKQMIGARQPGR